MPIYFRLLRPRYPHTSPRQPNPDAPRILVVALESCVYHTPATGYTILNVLTRAPPAGCGRVAFRPRQLS